jgi:hypothetical protein
MRRPRVLYRVRLRQVMDVQSAQASPFTVGLGALGWVGDVSAPS